MTRITIKDIARLLGVNPSTVSRALKDHPDISDNMKARVKQVADEMGYFPNFQAIHFRNRQSKLIALILPEMGRYFFPDLIKAVEEMVKKRGYSFVTFQSNDSFTKERECVDLCRSFGIDGLLIVLSRETRSPDHLLPLLKNGIPTVLVDKVVEHPDLATVKIDDYRAAYTTVRHLVRKKYQRIAGVFGDPQMLITQDRHRGFRAALEVHNLPFLPHHSLFVQDAPTCDAQLRNLLAAANRPDALFVMSDELLAETMRTLYEQKVSVPNDLAVISISNGHLPHYLQPKVTHLRHSGFEVGQQAANLLVDLIHFPDTTHHRQQLLDTFLVELDSC